MGNTAGVLSQGRWYRGLVNTVDRGVCCKNVLGSPVLWYRPVAGQRRQEKTYQTVHIRPLLYGLVVITIADLLVV